ncbi:MAG: recombinase family protein [Paludibacter sp.]|nr:recombinase family protein [Paludibacter sp.]
MKAALLLRVSTEQQDLDSQKNDLMPVALNFGYEVPDEYIFGEHITGKDDIRISERKTITRLKETCKTGGISVIFIYEVSRLSRSSIDGRSFLRDFNEMKIPIYFKDKSIWSLDPKTLEEDSNTTMIVGLFFDFAQQELKTLKGRTIDPLSEAIQIQGRFRDEHANGKRFNSLCHITNLLNFNSLTYEESIQELNEWLKTAKHLQERYNKA